MISGTDRIKSTNRALIIALIIAAFFLGSLTNRIATLEKNESSDSANVKGALTAPSDVPQQPQPAKVKPITSSDHIRGNANAKVTLVVYSDFECSFCQRFHLTTQELSKAYGDKIRLVYRHYPLPFHANAQKYAEASECIAELGGQDTFWKYTDTIFERITTNGKPALDKLGLLAAELGVDQQQFQSCLDSGKYEKLVKDSITEGQTAGVQGTPATFIIDSKGNSQLIVGAQPIEAFRKIIDRELTN